MRNTHRQVNRQASVKGILFAGVFGIFSTFINKNLLDAHFDEYNSNLSTKWKAYDTPQAKKNTPVALLQFQSVQNYHPLSIIPKSLEIHFLQPNEFLITSNLQRSPISHLALHNPPSMIHMNKL